MKLFRENDQIIFVHIAINFFLFVSVIFLNASLRSCSMLVGQQIDDYNGHSNEKSMPNKKNHNKVSEYDPITIVHAYINQVFYQL
jgi:hypothetical protein